MKVAIMADYEVAGGAGIAAGRLALGLVHGNHRVHWLTREPSKIQPPWTTHVLEARPSSSKLGARLPDSLRQADAARRVNRQLRELLDRLRPDVISVHNLHGARDVGWGVDMVAECQRVAPVVWTLHDMWSFTGGCAYSFDCTRYRRGCDRHCFCPDEYPRGHSSSLRPEWRRRSKLARRTPSLTVVAPSRWLAAEAASGTWRDHRILHIPYGLPLDTYKPIERTEARRRLGFAEDGLIAFVAALEMGERRKGSQMMGAVSKVLDDEGVLLVLAGKSMPQSVSARNVVRLGHLRREEEMRDAYNAADLVIHPAPVDNLPNTVLESIACGTLVVGLPTGGVPDMVVPGETGWLADEVSADALGTAVRRAVTELRTGKDLRRSCREYAERNYSLALQAKRYEALFSELGAEHR